MSSGAVIRFLHSGSEILFLIPAWQSMFMSAQQYYFPAGRPPAFLTRPARPGLTIVSVEQKGRPGVASLSRPAHPQVGPQLPAPAPAAPAPQASHQYSLTPKLPQFKWFALAGRRFFRHTLTLPVSR